MESKKVSRRGFLNVAVSAVVAGVVAGVGGYYAGLLSVPPPGVPATTTVTVPGPTTTVTKTTTTTTTVTTTPPPPARIPTGNIILNAYDNNGNPLSYMHFTEVTNGEAYATDLNNLPYYGTLKPPLVQAAATFAVLPQTPYKIHVLWEVPNFGKVMLSADNEGKGYSVDRQGGKLTLNFNYEAAKSKLAMLQRDYDLFRSQGYSVSDSIGEDLALGKNHLKLAEGYLMKTPSPDMKSVVAELNLSLRHFLWAHEQLQLDKAKADIEKYRKGSVKLKVVDTEDKPLSDCNVAFQQASHDFLFSANPVGKMYKYDSQRTRLLREAGINYSYINPTWRVIEPSPGKFDWGNVDKHQDIQAQLDDGFKLMGAYALRLSRSEPGLEPYPEYLHKMSFKELKQHVYDYMYTIASRYKGKIDTWEIYEANHANPFDLTWDQKLEIYQACAKAVTDANAEAKIAYASLALPYQWNRQMVEDTSALAKPISHLEFISLLIERQIPIDIIGVEFYYSGVLPKLPKIHQVTPGLDMVAVSEILDQYSSFGKPVFLREVSAPSAYVPGSSWWHRPWDEQTQAEYLEKLYTIAFGKPLLREICWSFGVSDDEAFMIGGGLLDPNLNPKQSYFALKNLIKSWTTTATGVTNETGEFELRGFAGDYDITLTSPDERSYKTRIHISEQEYNEVTVRIGPR